MWPPFGDVNRAQNQRCLGPYPPVQVRRRKVAVTRVFFNCGFEDADQSFVATPGVPNKGEKELKKTP